MPQRRIGLVVFDLGRVMIRLCDGWRHACERVGIAYRPQFDDPAVREKVLGQIFLCETGRLDQSGYCRATADLVGLTPEEVNALTNTWLDGPFPGWDGLLDRLAAEHVRTACLSNTSAPHWALMSEGNGPNRLPLERLTYRFASHLIGAHKPEPAIYRYVERTTGVTPRAILFFDDAAPNVEAARARGWAAQVIDTTRDPVTQVAEALEGYGVLPPFSQPTRGV